MIYLLIFIMIILVIIYIYLLINFEHICPTGECTKEHFCRDCEDHYSIF